MCQQCVNTGSSPKMEHAQTCKLLGEEPVSVTRCDWSVDFGGGAYS
jgi:hypothetical protein